MKAVYSKINKCRLCNSKDLGAVLKLKPTPPGDFFISAKYLNKVQKKMPLVLMLCHQCGNVQLSIVVNPKTIYSKYTYRSSVSLELSNHFREYADTLLTFAKPVDSDLVVEIGSNEGLLLNHFKNSGLRVLGIDPAQKIAKSAAKRGIKTITAFFSSELADKILKRYGPAKVIIANNVFANIDNLSDTVCGIKRILAPNGIFVIETSYLLDVLKNSLIDTIFHEHISYFSLKPLRLFFQRHNMEIINAENVSTKGGSLRVYIQHRDGPFRKSQNVQNLITYESDMGIHKSKTFLKYEKYLQTQKQHLVELLRNLKKEGKTIAAYGAAVGLTTMLYYFELGNLIDYIVDDNPIKQNTYSPGRHLPVYSPDVLYTKKPDYVVILAWRYAGPIMNKHITFQKEGGHFIIPLSEMQIL